MDRLVSFFTEPHAFFSLLGILGIVLVILAIIAPIQIRGFHSHLSPLQRFLLGTLGLIVAFIFIPKPHEPGILPKGTVIMWWGHKDRLPNGFEICDGTFSKDLDRKKPNLVARFPRGASADLQNHEELKQAGMDSVPLPEHTHSLGAHTHLSGHLFTAWGFRGAPQDENIFQQQIRGSFTGGVGSGSGGFREGENSLAQANGTAVLGESGVQPDKRNGTTGSTSATEISTLPAYQEIFFIIKVTDS